MIAPDRHGLTWCAQAANLPNLTAANFKLPVPIQGEMGIPRQIPQILSATVVPAMAVIASAGSTKGPVPLGLDATPLPPSPPLRPFSFAPLLESPGVYIPPSAGGTIIAKKFRTKLCQSFARNGSCAFGCRCMFAHGMIALRTADQNLAERITSDAAIKEFQKREAQCQSTMKDCERDESTGTPSKLPEGKLALVSCSYCIGAGEFRTRVNPPLGSVQGSPAEVDSDLTSIPPTVGPHPLHPTPLPVGAERGATGGTQTKKSARHHQHNPYSWTLAVQQQIDR